MNRVRLMKIPQKKFNLRAFSHAWDGIKAVVTEEPNCKVHAFFTVVAILAGFFFKLSLIEWAVILMAIGFVWAMEAINTAIEHTVDLCASEYKPAAKAAKDAAAAAVLFAAVTSMVLGIVIFLPKFLALIRSN